MSGPTDGVQGPGSRDEYEAILRAEIHTLRKEMCRLRKEKTTLGKQAVEGIEAVTQSAQHIIGGLRKENEQLRKACTLAAHQLYLESLIYLSINHDNSSCLLEALKACNDAIGKEAPSV